LRLDASFHIRATLAAIGAPSEAFETFVFCARPFGDYSKPDTHREWESIDRRLLASALTYVIRSKLSLPTKVELN
jgi:hypothetical protein